MDTENQGRFRKVRDNLICHLIDSTALLAESTPVFAALEVSLAGMDYDLSMRARVMNGVMLYLGTSTLYTTGRKLYRNVFNITEKTSEKIQTTNDALYTGLFTLVFSPIMYLASGARDPWEIGIGVVGAVGIGLVNGSPAAYFVDMFKDLTGVKDCERPSYPNILRRQKPLVKKTLVSLILAGTIAITAGIYTITPNNPEIQKISEDTLISQDIEMQNYSQSYPN